MSKLGLSLKISIPKKSKNVSKPSIKIEAKNKKGRVILEDEEYKVLLINESDGIHNRIILPFTKNSYDLKGRKNVFTRTKDEFGRRTRYIRSEEKAKFHYGDSNRYIPFAPNWIVKGNIIKDNNVLKFDFIDLITIDGYDNVIYNYE